MIKIYENYSLKNLNTFNINVRADFFVAPVSEAEVQEIIFESKFKNIPKLILGGGSNILFTRNFNGLIIHPQLKGINIESETKDYVIIKVGAAEIWDEFVKWSVERNFGGIENLSLIPGNVGACPVQNIGAYGVEVKDSIYEVHTIDLHTCKSRKFSNSDCKFNYRDSIFKNQLKNQYLITDVYFKLSKKSTFNIAYGNILKELEKFESISLKTIRQAVINIREAKLPDPKETPNAGSFFKNPRVSKQKYQELIKQFPNIVAYPINENYLKLAAGWLIDQSGLKGKSLYRAGVHKNQALVLVNLANASGKEVLELANLVKTTVFKNFGISLDFEVNIY